MHDPAKSAVLVTGATSGLGKDAALALDQLGFTVFAGWVWMHASASCVLRRLPVALDVHGWMDCGQVPQIK